MKGLVLVVVTWMVLAAAPTVSAHPVSSRHVSARHKTTPVTIRGIVNQLHRADFTLKTNTHGNLHVVVQRATAITERKHTGSFKLSEGDHVSVHGFLNGTQFTAISIQIVPVKAKQFSVRGIVSSSSGSRIVVAANGKSYAAAVTSGTGLQVANGAHQVLRGDRVLVRLEPRGTGYVAVRIRVYSRKVATGKHVTVQGILLTIQGSSLLVGAGSTHYSIRLSPSTALHTSTISAAKPKLAVGQRLTIHACCQGGPLTATSIHILVARVTHATQLLHGTVASVVTGMLVIRSSGGSVSVAYDRSTPVTLTGRPVGIGGLHSGDAISIHAWKNGSRWQAKSILIHAASRAPHTISGPAVGSAHAGGVLVAHAGKQYVVVTDKHTSITVGTKPTTLQSIRAGDHVKATGVLSGSQLAATRIQVTPTKPKLKSVRGTVQQAAQSEIVVAGDDGKQYHVRPQRGVRITLHGSPAPVTAISRGTRLHARGYLSGNVLAASTVTVTVKSRTIQGRVSRVATGRIDVESRSSTFAVDLPKGVVVADGGHSIGIGTVHVGAYVHVAGYVEGSLSLKAIRVDVYHPRITVVGTVSTSGSDATVKTASGKTFNLHIPAGVHIAVSRLSIALAPADLAVGMRIHAVGTVGTDGVVQVTQVSVRLTSLTLRGQVTKVESGALTVQAPDGTVRARLTSSTPIAQTTQSLKWNELVPGDDVTVYGYRLSPSAMLTRRVVVHRLRVTLTGTVASLTSDGFTVNASDGSHRVITTGVQIDTPSGQPIAVGATVHIRGYARGDGVILASVVTVKVL